MRVERKNEEEERNTQKNIEFCNKGYIRSKTLWKEIEFFKIS